MCLTGLMITGAAATARVLEPKTLDKGLIFIKELNRK
jgi:hypothetical protein